jgi:hypothetical protein
MSSKASTAALETSASRSRPNQRRAPRHPAGGKNRATRAEGQRGKEQARSFPQFQTAILQEDAMNATNPISTRIHHRTILPIIWRITFSLLLWTLGSASINLTEAQTRPQRIVKEFPVDRAKLEHLQRWVNDGHDTWCRDPKLVASLALSRVSPDFISPEFELASLPAERRAAHGTKSIYTFSTLDGRTSYRVTLRRYRWLLSTAGTIDNIVWVPVRIETITRPTTD